MGKYTPIPADSIIRARNIVITPKGRAYLAAQAEPPQLTEAEWFELLRSDPRMAEAADELAREYEDAARVPQELQ